MRNKLDGRVKRTAPGFGMSCAGAGLALCLLAGAAHAANFRVSMTDGSVLSGQIMSFEDGQYALRTSGGIVLIGVRGVARIIVSGPAARVTRTAAASTVPAFGSAPAGGGPASFNMALNSGEQVTGRITGFEDGVYTIISGRGLLEIPVKAVSSITVTSASAPRPRSAATPRGAPAGGGPATFAVALNSGEEVTGRITAFDDGIYTIISGRGLVEVLVRSVRRIALTAARASAPRLGPAPAGGQSAASFRIALSGGADVVGTITDFADGVYTVASNRGSVEVPVRAVTKIALLGFEQPPGQPAGQPVRRGTGPAGPALRLSGRITIAGSNSMGEALVPMLLESYAEAAGSKSATWLQSAGSLVRNFEAKGIAGQKLSAKINRRGLLDGLEALAGNNADIGMMSRPLTLDETDLLRQSGFPDPTAAGQEHVVGLSGIVVLVHPSNQVKSLSLDQIAGIFSRRLRSWSDVGGRRRRIRVFTPPEKSGEMAIFKQALLKDLKLSPTARRLPSSSELSDTISSDPSAIGFADYAFIRNAAAVAIKGPCGISHPPSEFAIQTEEYPLSGRLLFYSRPQTEGSIVDNFLKYVVSDEAQKRLSQNGAVSLLPTVAERDDSKFVDHAGASNQALLAQLRNVVRGGQRVSLTFRFATGTSRLDARASRDIERLAGFLRSDARSGKRVALLGFADSTGAFGRNRRLSKERAQIVANKLGSLGIKPDLVAGYSSLAPVVCETSKELMAKNRRVEVWLF